MPTEFKFAGSSFVGTMPVSPETCNLYGSMGVMHIHGKLDLSSIMMKTGIGKRRTGGGWNNSNILNDDYFQINRTAKKKIRTTT